MKSLFLAFGRAVVVAAVICAAAPASADDLQQGPIVAEPGFMMHAGSWRQTAAAQGKTFVVWSAADPISPRVDAA